MVKKRIGIDMDNGDPTSEGSVRERVAKGAIDFLKSGIGMNVEAYFYGDERKLAETFYQTPLWENAKIVPSSAFYTQGEELTRPRKGTSLNNMVRDIKDDKLDGFFSIGDTAKVGVEALSLRNKKIRTPSMLAFIPNQLGGHFIRSDVGFSSQNSRQENYQDAINGFAYAIYKQGIMALKYSTLHGVRKPRFGIHCIGTEQHKGSDVDKCLDGLINKGIAERGLGDFAEYLGKVESLDCYGGKLDVVLTDGYKGNSLIKEAEAVLKGTGYVLKNKIENLPWRQKPLYWLALPFLWILKKEIMKGFDPDKYNGAIILGLDGAVVKGHGTSSSKGIYNGLCRLYECAGKDFSSALEDAVVRYTPERKDAEENTNDKGSQ